MKFTISEDGNYAVFESRPFDIMIICQADDTTGMLVAVDKTHTVESDQSRTLAVKNAMNQVAKHLGWDLESCRGYTALRYEMKKD